MMEKLKPFSKIFKEEWSRNSKERLNTMERGAWKGEGWGMGGEEINIEDAEIFKERGSK